MLRYYMKSCHLLTLAIPQSYVKDVQLHTTRQRNGSNKEASKRFGGTPYYDVILTEKGENRY